MSVNYPERINALWTVFLLGKLFHTDLGLMPLFHGQTVALSDAHGTANVSGILWLMLAFFTLPTMRLFEDRFSGNGLSFFTDSSSFFVLMEEANPLTND